MPTLESMSAIKKYLNTLPKTPQYLFHFSEKTVERIIQRYSKRILGFIISWHSLRTTYVSRSAELEQFTLYPICQDMQNMEENQQGANRKQDAEIQVEIHLKEYEALREDMIRILRDQQQTAVLALGTASIIVPLLASQANVISMNIVAGLLYILAIIYSLIGMNYAFSLYSLSVVGGYIHKYIEPELNQIVPAASRPVLYWESFLRQERRRFPDLFLVSLQFITNVVLQLLPSAFALVTASFILQFPEISGTNEVVIRLSQLWIPILSISAWVLYLASIASFILAAHYASHA